MDIYGYIQSVKGKTNRHQTRSELVTLVEIGFSIRGQRMRDGLRVVRNHLSLLPS